MRSKKILIIAVLKVMPGTTPNTKDDSSKDDSVKNSGITEEAVFYARLSLRPWVSFPEMVYSTDVPGFRGFLLTVAL